MSEKAETRGFERGARWIIAAVNDAIQRGKVLPNQLPDVLSTLENLMNDAQAGEIEHQQHAWVAKAIKAVHDEEFESLE